MFYYVFHLKNTKETLGKCKKGNDRPRKDKWCLGYTRFKSICDYLKKFGKSFQDVQIVTAFLKC